MDRFHDLVSLSNELRAAATLMSQLHFSDSIFKKKVRW